MRRTKDAPAADPADQNLLNHIRSLGFDTVEEYWSWCAAQGFSQKLNKHWQFRLKERSHVQQTHTDRRLAQKKLEKRHGLSVLLAICHGEFDNSVLTHHSCSVSRTSCGPSVISRLNGPSIEKLSLPAHLASLQLTGQVLRRFTGDRCSGR